MKTKTPYVKLLHLFLIFLFLANTQSFSQILFQTSFEGSNPFAGMSNSQSCCSHSVTASTLHPNDGSQSFRSEVRPNDPPVSSGYRAELVLPNISDQGDMWYGWSMYFEANSNNNTTWGGRYGVTTQWHPSNSTGSAELAIYADDGAFDITVNPSGGAGGTHQTSGLQNIIANRWYDIVFHVNWASNGGSVEVWIDGQPYFSRTNLSWAQGAYFKIGMNRWLMTNTWVVFYDNLKIGRNVTYNDVAPNASTNPPANQPPVANAGNNITMTLPTNSATLAGSGTDADGTIASYAWAVVGTAPGTYTLGSPNSATTSLSNLQQGTYTFRLTVTDNAGATDTDDVQVTVNPPPNQPPTANAGNDIIITLPTNSATLTGSGSDPDGTITAYLWTKVGTNAATIVSPNSATTSITNLNTAGTYTFRLRVTDNNGATATDNVTITVLAAANQPPTANAGNNIVLTLPTNSTTLNGSGNDPDGTIASYAWAVVGTAPGTYTLGSPNSATTSLSNLQQGTYTFRLTVTDNGGATATDDVTVTVNAAANQPPVANAGNNIVLTLPANSTTLNGSGTDPDGTITSYAWTVVGTAPGTYTLGSPNSATTSLSNLQQGTYTFRLRVTDNGGLTDTDDITVVVNASTNQPPVVNAGSNIVLTMPTNSTLLNGSAADADGSIVSYAWTRTGGTGTYTFGSANSASTSLSNLQPGTYTFRLTATDNSGATGYDEVIVTVNASTNQPPIANAGNNIVLTLPTNSTTLNGSASVDPDGSIVSYMWNKVGGTSNTYTIGNANAATTSLTGLVQGTYTFQLTVTDNGGATNTDNITVTVNPAPPPVNQAPTANAGPDIIMTLPANSATLNGSGSDPDGSVSSYVWSYVSGPPTYALTSPGSASTGLTGLVQGTYVFRLTVTDNAGASATDNVTIIVNAAVPFNAPPVARTNGDVLLTLPTNYTQLFGNTSSDPDGVIVSYEWSQVSGPTQAVVANGNAAVVTVSDLTTGIYTFELKVTDDDGATATKAVRVTVENQRGNSGAFCNIFPNPTSGIMTMQYVENANGKLRITIFDVNRKLIRDEVMDKTQVSVTKTIDISTLQCGVYFIQITSPENVRIVKQIVKM